MMHLFLLVAALLFTNTPRESDAFSGKGGCLMITEIFLLHLHKNVLCTYHKPLLSTQNIDFNEEMNENRLALKHLLVYGVL